MITSLSHGRPGIRWKTWMRLDYLDFYTKDNNKCMWKNRCNSTLQSNRPHHRQGENLDHGMIHREHQLNHIWWRSSGRVEAFTYLASIIDKQRGSDLDMKAKSSKARAEFLQLMNTYNSKQLSPNAEVGILNAYVFLFIYIIHYN